MSWERTAVCGEPQEFEVRAAIVRVGAAEQKIAVPNVASRTSLSKYDCLCSMRNSEACERMMS